MTKTATLTVKNEGESDSSLNWQVDTSYYDHPDCVTNIDPSSGTNLLESSDGTKVTVTIQAPNEKESSCSGGIKFVNSDDSSDYKVISVSVSTPKTKNLQDFFLIKSFNRFTILKEFLFSLLDASFKEML